ncbi:MAG TPA: cyclic nucleotide-binding domain-containing protein [Chloroflexota bacterium]|nr:cyclic nucleotide-binding domain-containing protein [Chloroflexota bacterium]
MTTEELLARVDLFRSLNKKHLAQVARLAERQQYAPGQVIVKQGDTGLGLYVIVSGSVDVQQERAGAEPINLNSLGPGDFFGEMALLDDYPRSATVIAREPTECLTLSKWHFLAELESHPEMALPLLPVLSRRLRAAMLRAEAQS